MWHNPSKVPWVIKYKFNKSGKTSWNSIQKYILGCFIMQWQFLTLTQTKNHIKLHYAERNICPRILYNHATELWMIVRSIFSLKFPTFHKYMYFVFMSLLVLLNKLKILLMLCLVHVQVHSRELYSLFMRIHIVRYV